MKKFNTKYTLSFLTFIAFLFLGLTPGIFAQSTQDTNDNVRHKIIIKKKIVTEDGQERIVEEVFETDSNEIILDEGDGDVEVEVTRGGTDDEQIRVVVKKGSTGLLPSTTCKNSVMTIAEAKNECEKSKSFGIAGQGDHPGMFHFKRGMNHPGFQNMQVVRLQEGELIPESLADEITKLGLDVNQIQDQFDAAERMVHISQIGETAALVEVDGPEPESLKGFMLHEQTKGIHSLPRMPERLEWNSRDGQNFNSDFNYNFNFNDEGENSFNFEFNGEIPDEIKEKLKEKNIFLDKLSDGKINIITPEGSKDVDVDIESENGFHRFEIRTDKDFFGDMSIEDIDIDIPGLEGLESLNFLKNWNPGMDCDVQSADDKAFLGVMIGNVNETGVEVTDVIGGGAAEAAGIQSGDRITKIGEYDITSVQGLIDAVAKYKVGENVSVSFVREGVAQSAAATLQGRSSNRIAKAEAPEFRLRNVFPRVHVDRDRSWMHDNTDCEKLCNSPFLGVLIEYNDETDGVRISSIFESTGAEKAALLENDIITSIEGEEMSSTEAVVKKVLTYEPGDVIKVNYLRDGKKKSVKATLGTKANSGAYNPCDCETGELKQPETRTDIIILKEKGEALQEEVPNVSEDLPVVEAPAVQKPLQLRSFSLFPNPNSGSFTVSFRAEKVDPITVSVVDVTGREVFRELVSDFNGNYYNELNISENGGGVYFLNVIQGDEIWTERFVYSRE